MGRLRVGPGSLGALGVFGTSRLPFMGTAPLLDDPAWSTHHNEVAALNHTNPLEHSDLMKVSGIRWNQSGDLEAFVSGLVVNSLLVFVYLSAFVVLCRAYPAMFAHNAMADPLRGRLPDGPLGWAKASWHMTTEERSHSAGLDIAMAIKFHSVCARLLLGIGFFILLSMWPLDLVLRKVPGEDALLRTSMSSLPYYHPWIYHLVALAVWVVVLLTESCLRKAQAEFLALRTGWLRRQPLPRAATVLVEGIPPEYCSDARLKAFFERAMGAGRVREAHVMKFTGGLPALVERRAAAQLARHTAALRWAKAGGQLDDRVLSRESCLGTRVDAIGFHEREIEELGVQIAERRASIWRLAAEVGGVNTNLGFVTFHSPRDADVAMALRYSYDREEWRMSLPPEPGDVNWQGMACARSCTLLSAVIGHLIAAGLYMGFLPISLTITNLAFMVDMGPLQPMWTAFAPTLGLMIFVSLLPSAFLWIFQQFMTHRSDTWVQHRLQEWYFWFQVFFIVLVTAVGNDFADFMKRVAAQPFSLFQLLADKLPYATHFYFSYLVLQWSTHALHCLRPANLLRFILARQLFSEEEARRLSEPEDQGYYGLGSRSARWTINATVGLVFCTLSPIVPLLAAVDFALCRLLYGYLLIFAETRKNDLGGAFWVTQMQHMRVGLMIYCVLMIGFLAARTPNAVPLLLAGPSLLYVFWSYWQFDSSVCMGGMPIVERSEVRGPDTPGYGRGSEALEDNGQVYVQPELLED